MSTANEENDAHPAEDPEVSTPPSDSTGDSPDAAEQAAPEVSAEELRIALGRLDADRQRLEKEKADFSDRWSRLLTEFKNYKERVEREQRATREQITMKVIEEFVPVLDDFGRATEASAASDATAMLSGLEMIRDKLAGILEQHGVAEIEAKGALFDHNLHDALMQVDNPEVPEGTILEVVERGYVLNTRLLRPAKVVVARGGPAPAKPDSEESHQSEEAPPSDGE